MKTQLLMMSFVLSVSLSCKKEEFYEKQYLKENGNEPIPMTSITPPEEDNSTSTEADSSSASDASSSSTTGSTGSSDSSSSSADSSSTTGSAGSSDSSSSSADSSSTTGSAGSSDSSSSSADSSSTTGSAGSSDSSSSSADSSSTTGSAGNPEYQLDEYMQKADSSPVDILWIVDSSGSMEDEQASLAANFNYFISDFVNRSVNFNMGITTTDPRSHHAGVMKNPDQSLSDEAYKNNANQFFNDFRNYIRVGTNGSGNEQGLNAVEKFVTKNTSFLRNDSYLSIIIVTDEEDQSVKSVNEYIDFIKQFKSQEKIKVYLIVDTDNNIIQQYGIVNGHVRYEQFLNGFSGQKDNINGNFSESLKDIGSSIASLADSFSLTKKPVENTITVKVNGVLSTEFIYSSTTNSIQFKDGFVPQEGAKVEINYEIQ